MLKHLVRSAQQVHLGVALALVLLQVLVAQATRLALLLREWSEVEIGTELASAFLLGPFFDLGAALLAALPLIVFGPLIPARIARSRIGQGALWVFVALASSAIWFQVVAEWLFWDEFRVRFNFIAVDYLVYTTEVLGNIRESYPMPLILAAVLAAGATTAVTLKRSGWLQPANATATPSRRALWGSTALVTVAASATALRQDMLPTYANTFHRELAKDGLWSLFAAFWDNELPYGEWYRTVDEEHAMRLMEAELAAHDCELLPGAAKLSHRSTPRVPHQRLNVIQITVESLSARYLGCFGGKDGLTPEIDRISQDSLVFRNLYATGTRTTRGMEALVTGLPPTPGRSIVKREQTHELFSLGSVFREEGYDTVFLYSGYGYFDNMNAFFGRNGYRIVDRSAVEEEDVTFANAWGACDGDLYDWCLREADRAHSQGQPFHHFVMTTSNHRPYTYPEGCIEAPSGSTGRRGAIQYTDFAIGELLQKASKRPWFNETVFVIVADHCAAVAGKAELPVDDYWIPMLIHTPGGQVAPGDVDVLMSQVDVGPTVLGLLGMTPPTQFFGWDVLAAPHQPRALIGNYQRLGLLAGDSLTVLAPEQQVRRYSWKGRGLPLTPLEPDPDQTQRTIAYDQTASRLYADKELRPAQELRSGLSPDPR